MPCNCGVCQECNWAASHEDQRHENLETEAIGLVADLVAQCCFEKEGVYETCCIRVYKDAMKFLVKQGVMEEVKDGIGRNYWARFKS